MPGQALVIPWLAGRVAGAPPCAGGSGRPGCREPNPWRVSALSCQRQRASIPRAVTARRAVIGTGFSPVQPFLFWSGLPPSAVKAKPFRVKGEGPCPPPDLRPGCGPHHPFAFQPWPHSTRSLARRL